ncbi:IS3 family transposase [uncultured Gordonia sp.]|uniref:IS3 family transposase n=1 Tax=uncultured Gordonia sp. TaxID=198437 RepID=UPI002582B369|nr:IS3 family transposase [uncultured Gordonia sp.]
MRFQFIAREEGNHPVEIMCHCLQVSTSGYYAWKKRGISDRAKARVALADRVRKIFTDNDSTYGYRRVHAELARTGVAVDDDTVRQIMADLGLEACQRRRGPRTTMPAECVGLPDLLRRDFTADRPGHKLVGDITYIATWAGWVYLATVLDCFSKKVVGYSMSSRMTADLVCDALRKASERVDFLPGETLFHSDRGVQYMSGKFMELCRELGVVRSVGRTGVCWDNAWAESFNGSLKNELVNRKVYPTRRHAINDVTTWIELRYNRTRLHSALGYRTPDEVEAEWFDRHRAS